MFVILLPLIILSLGGYEQNMLIREEILRIANTEAKAQDTGGKLIAYVY